MASYQTNYDPGSYQVAPYQLPVQQITQAIATRTAYWDQGASQVKQAYENYLGLDLSLDANRAKLDGLMKGVNDNLKKVRTMDLSINSNVDDAMRIFDPIANDDDIKYDNAFTKFQKQQNQSAESYKSMDKGEQYSADNVKYMNMPYEAWVKSQDPSKTKEAFANRRTYDPYFDYNKEKNDLIGKFKPDVNDITEPTTTKDKDGKTVFNHSGYLVETRNKSVYASQLRAYLDANLSDKAKHQLQIEGVVKYGDNMDALAGDYVNHNKTIISNNNIRREQLVGQLKVKDNTPAEVAAYNDQIRQIDAENTQRTGINTKLQAKDYSDLSKVKDQVAGTLYSNGWIDNVAKATQHKDIYVKYGSDATELFRQKQDAENSKFNTQLAFTSTEKALDRQNAMDIARLKVSAKGSSKTKDSNGNDTEDGIVTNTEQRPATEADNVNQSQATIEKMQSQVSDMKNAALQTLTSAARERIQDYDGMTETARDAAVNKWMLSHPDDPAVQDFSKQMETAHTQQAVHDVIVSSAEEELKKSHPALFNRVNDRVSQVESGGRIQIADNRSAKDIGKPSTVSYMDLSKEDVKKIIAGTHPTIKVSRGGTDPTHIGSHNVISINGKNYDLQGGVLNNILEKISKDTAELNTYRNDAYSKKLTKIQGYEAYSDPGQEELKGLKRKIASYFPSDSKDKFLDPLKDVNLLGRDVPGGVYFNIASDISKDKKKQIVERLGGRYNEASGDYYLPNNKVPDEIKPRTFEDPRLDLIAQEVRAKTPETGISTFSTTPIKFNGRPFQFRVRARDGVPVYDIIDAKSQVVIPSPGVNGYGNLADAASRAASWANVNPALFTPEMKKAGILTAQDYFINFIRTVGKKPDYTEK